jgi:hypothetical protein
MTEQQKNQIPPTPFSKGGDSLIPSWRNKIKGEKAQIILEERASSNRLSLSFGKKQGESGHN